MNQRLKLAFKNSSTEQGFAIPIAVGMGLIMILVATTMIVRSQGDQVTASSQKGAAQSLAISEGGVARSLSTLKQLNNGFYLKLNYDPINPATNKTYLGADGIPNSGDEVTTAVNQWSNPPNATPCSSSGSIPSGLTSGKIGSVNYDNYEIKAYRYRDPDGVPRSGDEIGTLLVEGKQGGAESQVQVSMPIVQTAQAGTFAGLYASNSIDLGNNDILKVTGGNGSAANVICKDCVVPSNQCVDGTPTPAGLNSAVGRGPNSAIDGNIIIGDPQLPPVPTASTTACSATSGPNCSISIGSITNDMTLPRPTDVAARATWLASNPTQWSASTLTAPYHYVVSGVSLSGSEVVTINTTTAPVYLYVSGNVSFGGSSSIAHSGTPDRLRLYGKPADANNSNDQSITISGGSSTANMFIFAPDATVGINGGSSDPDLLGAVWAKTWDGSSSNNAEIRVPDNMPTLLGGSFSGVGMQAYGSSAPTNWQRQPVQ